MIKKRQTLTITHDLATKLIVGKSYKINGRPARILAIHHDGQGANAAGWSSCIPMITVKWKV